MVLCFGVIHTAVSSLSPMLLHKPGKLFGSASWPLVELYFSLSLVPYKKEVANKASETLGLRDTRGHVKVSCSHLNSSVEKQKVSVLINNRAVVMSAY